MLRRNGGVNLRNPWGVCLAEVQTLVWIPLLLTVVWCLWHALGMLWALLTAPYDEHGPPPYQQQQQHQVYHRHAYAQDSYRQ